MKKISSLVLLLSLLGLTACGENSKETTNNSQSAMKSVEDKETTVETTVDEKEDDDAKVDEKETNGPLLEVGQYINDPGVGIVTLTKIANVTEKEYESGGLQLVIKGAKVLTVTDMVSSYKDKVSNYGDVSSDEFTYLQVTYDIKNTTENTILFSGLELAVPDNGNQIDIYGKDIHGYQNPVNNKILSKSSVEGNIIGIPVDRNINSIRLMPSVVFYDTEKNDSFNFNEIEIEF